MGIQETVVAALVNFLEVSLDLISDKFLGRVQRSVLSQNRASMDLLVAVSDKKKQWQW